MKKIFFIFFSVLFIFINISLFAASDRKDVKIYDCFPFFDELDILEIRLNELYDVVDYFVIVENELTFSGKLKPLFFEQNKQRFSKFLDKIIHVRGPKINFAFSPWVRENAQRNDILLGLRNAKDSDIILVSDVDEIINSKKINEIKMMLSLNQDPIRLSMKMYRFFLNRQDTELNHWCLPYAITMKTLKTKKKYAPQYFRTIYEYKNILNDAGWHFTSHGWTKKYIYKLESWAHQERNVKRNKEPKNILLDARHCCLVEIDNTYPKYITQNIEYFKKINFIDDNLPIEENIKLFDIRQKMIEDQKN